MLRMIDRHAVHVLLRAGHATYEAALWLWVTQRTTPRIAKKPRSSRAVGDFGASATVEVESHGRLSWPGERHLGREDGTVTRRQAIEPLGPHRGLPDPAAPAEQVHGCGAQGPVEIRHRSRLDDLGGAAGVPETDTRVLYEFVALGVAEAITVSDAPQDTHGSVDGAFEGGGERIRGSGNSVSQEREHLT
jgi:hypothetical protein